MTALVKDFLHITSNGIIINNTKRKEKVDSNLMPLHTCAETIETIETMMKKELNEKKHII
jgi:hypothetical protein